MTLKQRILDTIVNSTGEQDMILTEDMLKTIEGHFESVLDTNLKLRMYNEDLEMEKVKLSSQVKVLEQGLKRLRKQLAESMTEEAFMAVFDRIKTYGLEKGVLDEKNMDVSVDIVEGTCWVILEGRHNSEEVTITPEEFEALIF